MLYFLCFFQLVYNATVRQIDCSGREDERSDDFDLATAEELVKSSEYNGESCDRVIG